MSTRNSKSSKGTARKGPGFKARTLGEPEAKKKVNSKVKGNRNELEVAKALTKWTGVEFRRVPMSGAIHVPLDWLNGDVFCVDKHFNFPWSVETKHYDRLYPKMKRDFWIQACTDAARINKRPMLMYRENNWPAGTWKVQLDIRGLISHILYPKFEWPPLDGTKPSVLINSTDLFDIPYNEFLKLL